MNLKELSRKLGLSPTTVSRALNGYPEVSERTRRRVHEAAERYGYAPNMRAKRLATGRSMSIGHVLPMSTKHEMVNPVFADFIAGAGESYSRAGYDLLLSVINDGEEDGFYRDLAARGSVDGVVVHGPRLHDTRIGLLNQLGLPFIVHGRSSAVTENYSWLDMNNRRAFYRATRFLLDLGHRRIGLVNGLADMDFAVRREEGYAAALEEYGIAPDPGLVWNDEMTENYGFCAARRMLAGPDAPTAFLASSIIPAIGVRRAVEDLGLKLGRDVSVVTHDDQLSYFVNDEQAPIFTATRSSVREAGRLAAEMLLDIIDAPNDPPRQTMLEAELIVGQSTGPAPAMRRALKDA